MSWPGLAELHEQVARLVDEAGAIAHAIRDELQDARRSLLGSHYARLRRATDADDPAAGSLARALRGRRLGLWPGAAAMPPPYAGPAHWPRAMAGRSQLLG